jgi:hypothetical protein
MKKQKLQNLLKLGILILGISLFLTSCEKESNLIEETTEIQTQHKLTIKHVSKDKVLENNILNSKIEALTSKIYANKDNLSNKGGAKYVKDYDFIIDLESAIYIEDGDYNSYTFPIIESKTQNIRNVLFTLNDKNEYDAFLVNYSYTAEQLKTLGADELSKRTEMIPVNLDFNSLFSKMSTEYVCNYVYEYVKTGTEFTNGNSNLIVDVYSWVLTASYCETINYYNDVDNYTPTVNYDPNTGQPIYGGGGSFSTSPTISTYYDEPDLIMFGMLKTTLGLNLPEYNWLVNPENNNYEIAKKLFDFLGQNLVSEEAKVFAKELFDLAKSEPNQNDVNNLVNLTLLIENSGNQLFTDEFATSLFEYTDINITNLPPDYPFSLLTLKVYLNYQKIRQLNPEWSRRKCIWFATKEIIHISLDAFGLIPVFGEVADLTNGLIYAIEGDNLNATLSVASAIPFVGYGSFATKYGLKVVNSASTITTKVKLVWKVTANGIEFGSRTQLRKVLGLAVGDARQAHHLIPWERSTHPVVQKAAKSGNAFHMNEALNGIPRPSNLHLTGHSTYNTKIRQILDGLDPNASVDEAYDYVSGLANHIRTLIDNNPTLNSGQIANLISYP